MDGLSIAKLAAKALDNKKAQDIKVLKVEDLTILADYFVIASGTSNTHVGALADEVEFSLEKSGIRPLRTEGAKTRSWVLMDYGNTIVHIFYPDTRNFYELERLWADAQTVPVELD